MKSQSGTPKVRDNVKCKEWERKRRDRLNEAFKGLAELLPNHDPARDPPKVDVLDKATQFIKELRLSNSRLLSNQTQKEETHTRIQELQDELNKLIIRVKQLTRLLNQAKIPIPMGPYIKSLGKKRLKWTNKISNEDMENSKFSEPNKTGENILPGVPTVTIMASPLKEANSGDPGGNAEKVNTPTPEKLAKEKLPTSNMGSSAQPVQSISTMPGQIILPNQVGGLRMPTVLLQPSANNSTQASSIQNMSFPLQTTAYILTSCPIQPLQQQIISPFSIGASPRLILRKPPLSSGDVPKVAIPLLKRKPSPPRVPPPPKRRRGPGKKKSKRVAATAKSSQTDTTEPISNESNIPQSKPANPVQSSVSSETESVDPQPILVDISGEGETEVNQSQSHNTLVQSLSPLLQETSKGNVQGESTLTSDKVSAIEVTEESKSTSQISSSDKNPALHITNKQFLCSESKAGMVDSAQSETTPSQTSNRNDKEIEVDNSVSTATISTSIATSTPECSNVNVKSTAKETANHHHHEIFADIQNHISETVTTDSDSTQDRNKENLENIRRSLADELIGHEETGVSSSESCVLQNSDKISECIARSIDLIDHPEAELIELGADWGVGESHSPKSPISPTQMFLSMFPLLPRESIVTAAGSLDGPVETLQQTQQNSSIKTSNSHFGSGPGNRSSFFIDSMLPDIPEQSTDIGSISTIINSTCLAVTPLPPGNTCLQPQTMNTTYSLPTNFQSLANIVVSSTSSSTKCVNTTASSTKPVPSTTTTPSSNSSEFYQIPQTNSTVSGRSKVRQSTSTKNFVPSSTFDPCQIMQASGHSGGNENQKANYEQFYTFPSTSFTDKPSLSNNALSSNSAAHSHTISQMFNSFTTSPARQQQQQQLTHTFDNYSYYPQTQETNFPLYNPSVQNPLPVVNNPNKFQTQSQNNISSRDCRNQNQTNERVYSDSRSGPGQTPQPQPQPNSNLFHPASNLFSSNSATNLNPVPPPPLKQIDNPEKQRSISISTPSQNTNKLSQLPPAILNTSQECILPQNTSQTFSHQHYIQSSPRQYQPVFDTNFNFTQNQKIDQTQNQNPNLFQSKSAMARSCPGQSDRSSTHPNVSSTPASKQTSTRVSNVQFNADFLAYSTTQESQPLYQGHRQGQNTGTPSQCSYDMAMTQRPSAPPSVSLPTQAQPPKTTYRPTGQQQPTMQLQPPAITKSRRPPFYLPDSLPPPPFPILPTSNQYQLPNYSNQSTTVNRQSQPAAGPAIQTNFTNNFVPQFYNNMTSGGNKEYQLFTNQISNSQSNTKPGTEFYQTHQLPHQHQHHQQPQQPIVEQQRHQHQQKRPSEQQQHQHQHALEQQHGQRQRTVEQQQHQQSRTVEPPHQQHRTSTVEQQIQQQQQHQQRQQRTAEQQQQQRPADQRHQQQSQPPPSSSKKSSSSANAVGNNNVHPSLNRVNPNHTQNQMPQNTQIPVSRPVNWMTDPPHKKQSNNSTTTVANNPFSVSKLVGNSSNTNYFTEALIRKNPNPEWNDFPCFLTPMSTPSTIPVPPVSSIISTPATPNLNQQSSQSQSFPSNTQIQIHPPQINNDYFTQNYPMNSNFGHFDPQLQHNYTTPNQMNLPEIHGQVQGNNNISQIHNNNGTTTSVSNFNMSSILHEFNDKRGNNNNSTNCGYFGSSNNTK